MRIDVEGNWLDQKLEYAHQNSAETGYVTDAFDLVRGTSDAALSNCAISGVIKVSLCQSEMDLQQKTGQIVKRILNN